MIAGCVLDSVKQLKSPAVRGKLSDKHSRSGAGRTEFGTDGTGMTVKGVAELVACITGTGARRETFCQCRCSGGSGRRTELVVRTGRTVRKDDVTGSAGEGFNCNHSGGGRTTFDTGNAGITDDAVICGNGTRCTAT